MPGKCQFGERNKEKAGMRRKNGGISMTDHQIKVLETLRIEMHDDRFRKGIEEDALTAALEYIRDMREIEGAAEEVIFVEKDSVRVYRLQQWHVWGLDRATHRYDSLREAFKKAVKGGKDTAFEADGTSRWNRRAASLRWTRVEDRLPEKPGDFITTRIKNTDGTGLTVRETHFDPNNPHLIKIWMEVVKAWMPLPQPFTEDTDEQR